MRAPIIPISLSFSAVAVLAAACAGTPDGAPAPGAGAAASALTSTHRCPMEVPGTEVALETDAPDPALPEGAVVLRFDTDRGEGVPELRDRVQAVAERIGREGLPRLAERHAAGDPGRPAGWAAVGRDAAAQAQETGEDPGEAAAEQPYATTQGDVEAEGEEDRRMGQENLAKHEALMVPEDGAPTPELPALQVEATARATPEGARLLLVPVGGTDAEALREELRWRVSMMNAGQCPMTRAEAGSGAEPPGEAP